MAKPDSIDVPVNFVVADHLTHDERLRLEALAQSVAAAGALGERYQIEGDEAATRRIVGRAETFATFIRGGTQEWVE